jgi:hypothetical protein
VACSSARAVDESDDLIEPWLVAIGVERLINAFAIHLLLPREPVTEVWRAVADQDARLAAVLVSVRFRASWTATCSQLRTLGLIDATEREQFTAAPPSAADFIALGERWEAELHAPAVPPEYGEVHGTLWLITNAIRSGKLSEAEAVRMID